MSNWPIAPLGSVVKFVSGGTPSKEEARFWNGDIPWVSSAEMTQRWIADTRLRVTEDGAREGSKRVPKNTVLVVVRGMSLANEFRVSISQRDVTFNQDVKAALPTKAVDPVFLFFYLLSQSNGIRDSASEAAHGTKKLDMPVLEQWPIPIPPMETQQKIAAILSAYDDLIANNQRRITLLERMAEDIYREWFVRLRFPGHENVARDKGVPAGWNVRSLGDVLELCYGKALKDEDRQSGTVPVYGSGGVVGVHSTSLVDGPGIVVGRKGNVGSVFWSERAFFPIDTAYFVRSATSLYYLIFLLRSMNFINNDSAVPGLSRQQAYSNKLLFPPNRLIEDFTAQVKVLFDAKRVLSAQNEVLKATRDALLPRLISGKLSVDALDIRFPPGMVEAG